MIVMENSNSDISNETLKKEARNARNKKGFSIIIIGVSILFSGFLCNLLLSISNPNYNYFLYGLTSLGVILVFYGLYLIFE
jgi:hypothetical protein